MAAERSAAVAVQNLEAAEAGKVDPMKQFTIEPILGSDWQLADGINIAFTNSALWMAITAVLVWVFVAGGMKRQLVPGRWQMAVESMTGFIDDLLEANVGAAGRKYVPYIFTLFMFILFGNLLGLVPVGLIPGVHAFTFTSHFTVTGVLAIMSFSIVLIVGFAKHGFHFFSLFWPSNTPAFLALPISLIELVSFMVRPFSLALRLFVAMMAGHVLLKVLASFVIAGGSGGIGTGVLVGVPSFVLMVAISALEILVAGIQAYVFALLTSLYINDAENLH
ncbi:F-type H+-transporting ATPase subunit a [Erythromicrobium ramosum]|uniref:ATP synthase subunit a n=1 Tax=Erythrobacter ramosus TaxID=35811 RepID=A0A6I4UMX2_9SPHN|nr:F0F1 ATP synthase subunit A [Erythrobacter ramosus]MBB3775784.1 F-type H+-transporting ATPase subunit a [Erythrobacter ramosus]MXP39124.1 F0F1 ATP synthase subunit A [Erythrobacter ramosus]